MVDLKITVGLRILLCISLTWFSQWVVYTECLSTEPSIASDICPDVLSGCYKTVTNVRTDQQIIHSTSRSFKGPRCWAEILACVPCNGFSRTTLFSVMFPLASTPCPWIEGSFLAQRSCLEALRGSKHGSEFKMCGFHLCPFLPLLVWGLLSSVLPHVKETLLQRLSSLSGLGASLTAR